MLHRDLTDEDKQIIAAESMRLKNDPAFERAYRYLYDTTVEAMINTDPTDTVRMVQLQAEVKVMAKLANLIALAARMADDIPAREADMSADTRPMGTA